MQTVRALGPCLILVALATARAMATDGVAADTGLYTSAIFENKAAMKSGRAAASGCMWKGRWKREGKSICKGGLQLKCGSGGWYKTGPC